ncbi:MAG: hemolysin III family protein [Bacillota bacterium]|nr:hemolysin III family protein [Bacillota bacterium]
MTKTKVKRPYTFGEEIAHGTTHGPMALISLGMLPYAAIRAYLHGGALAAVGVSVFVISLFLMFLSSTLYHVMSPDSRHKQVFQIFDHIFIYFAIAGSYTPIALSVIGGWQGIVITAIQWVMVLFGILYNSLAKKRIPKLSLTIYLVMGWTIVLFFPLFWSHANTVLISLIFAGGVMYSAGAYFYSKHQKKYFHMIWHLFVNLGAVCHFIGITFFLQ